MLLRKKKIKVSYKHAIMPKISEYPLPYDHIVEHTFPSPVHCQAVWWLSVAYFLSKVYPLNFRLIKFL